MKKKTYEAFWHRGDKVTPIGFVLPAEGKKEAEELFLQWVFDTGGDYDNAMRALKSGAVKLKKVM